MKRIVTFFLIFCLMLCTLSGCHKQIKPLCRVVVGMEISGQHQDVQFTKNYTDTNVIEEILQCLRIMQLRNKTPNIDESATRDYFLIALHLSDGNTHHYALVNHRYFKAPRKSWVSTDPEIVSKFYGILQKN